jgi:hypothetical protein
VALSDYALVSVDEARAWFNVQGTEKRDLIELVINTATDAIESHLRRELVTRGSLTEWHSPDNASEIYVLDYPIISVTTVHESSVWPRVYDATSLLVEDTDYQVMKKVGKIRRIGTGGVRVWESGARRVQVVYTAGYANTASVPYRLKKPCLKLGALLWAETTRNQFGVSGMSDGLGNWTRFAAAGITGEIAADLETERRIEFSRTGERAA